MEYQASWHEQLDQWEKEKWRMDSEKSHAYFISYRLREGDKVRYQFNYGIEIKPYPNPLSFGGCWCSGGAKDEEALEEHLGSFKKEVARWQKQGLVKVEIKEGTEVDLAAQRRAAEDYLATHRPREYAKEHQASLF